MPVDIEEMLCPKCGAECWRHSIDIGIGIQYGPFGCPECCWSESPEYDRSDGKTPPCQPEGYYLDQFGAMTKVDGIVEKCKRFGIPEQMVRDAFK